MKDGGLILWECHRYLRKCPRPLGRWENAIWKTIWRTIQRAGENSSIWLASITRKLSGLWADRGRNLERRYLDSRPGKIWKSWTHEIFVLEESTQRKYWSDNKMMSLFIFPIAQGAAKLSGRDCEFLTLRRDQPVRSEDFRWEIQGESEGHQPTETKDDAEARKDFWSIQGDFIYRYHHEPRVQLYVPKEETFPIPLKYIDVTRSPHTDLDVMQEKRVDDYWKVDSNRSLSDSWTVFTKFTLLKEKPPKGYMWSGERLTEVPTTTRPDHVWPEVWTQIGKSRSESRKQEWAKEKPKRDNACKLKGILRYWSRWQRTFRNSQKNARRKLEIPMAPAMPCKKMAHTSITKVMQSNGNEKEFKTMYGWTVKSHESTRQRSRIFAVQNWWRSHCWKGVYFYDTLQLGAQVYSDATSDENSGCNGYRGQGMEKARDDPSMEIGKFQEQKGDYSRSTKRQKESPLCNIDGHLSPQKNGVKTNISEVWKAESCSVVTL